MTEMPEASLADTFNAFARKAIDDFPELKNELAIYHAPTDTLYGCFDEDQRDTLLALVHKSLGRSFSVNGKSFDAGAGTLNPSTFGEGHHLMNWYDSQPSSLFKHELGHLVAPGGCTFYPEKPNFAECVADVFQLFYHQQDDGPISEETARCKKLGKFRSFLSGDMLHTTFPVMQAAEELSAAYDLSAKNLSPVEAANLAYRLAVLYAPSPDDLMRMKEIFKPMEGLIERAPGNYATKCIEIMLADHGKDTRMVFMMAKSWLEGTWIKYYPLDEQKRDLLAKIAEKERALQKEAEAPEQRLEHETSDMMVLGRFDKNPNEKIDPAVYESKGNTAYLKRVMDVYAAIRFYQETDAPLPEKIKKALAGRDAKTLGRDEIVALSCKLAAAKPIAQAPHFKSTP